MYMQLKKAKCGKDFQENSKKFVANMHQNKKMLHKKNCCKDSKFMYEYVDFDNLEDAKNFEPRLSFCQICFNKNV